MSEPWKPTTIRQCLVESFAGEWGSDPKPGNAKVLRATDIDDDGHVVGPGAIRQLPIGKLTAKRLLDGDILLEGSGGGPGKPVGRVAYFEANDHYEAAVCSNFFKTLRPNRSEVEPRFLLRKLAWFYKQPALLTLQQQTTGIINLKFEEYLSAQIEIPETIGEQQILASVLDTLDTAIHETEAIIAKLKAVKQGLLHDLLTCGIAANGELRPSQAEASHLYKQSPLGWIPKEWGTPLLQNVSTRVTDGTHQAVTSVADGGGEVPFLVVSCVRDGEIAWDKAATITKRDYWRISKGRDPAAGMILYTAVGSYGHAAEVSDTREFAFQRHIACIYPDERYVVAGFMPLVLNWEPMRGYADRVAIGNAQKTITLGELSQYPFVCPKKAEQEDIVRRMRSAQEKLNGEVGSLNKLRLQKVALMDDLLTGRVRVTPLQEGTTR